MCLLRSSGSHPFPSACILCNPIISNQNLSLYISFFIEGILNYYKRYSRGGVTPRPHSQDCPFSTTRAPPETVLAISNPKSYFPKRNDCISPKISRNFQKKVACPPRTNFPFGTHPPLRNQFLLPAPRHPRTIDKISV